MEAKQRTKAPSIDISTLPEKQQEVYKAMFSMFSIFPKYDGISMAKVTSIDLAGQVKVLTLEIVKIHVAESEHRVAHLMLSGLCKEYPNDAFLWNYLGKLYLDIGKRQAAVDTFSKSEETLATITNASKEIIDANKLLNA